jgi:hypothetical protein
MANTYQFASSMNQMEHYQKNVTRFYGGVSTQTYGESNSGSLAPVACALDVTLSGFKFNLGATLTLAVSGGLNVTQRNGDTTCFVFGVSLTAAKLASTLAAIESSAAEVDQTTAALTSTAVALQNDTFSVAKAISSIQI